MTDLLPPPRIAGANKLDQLVAGVHQSAALPLERATTMPPGVYDTPEYYDLEVERLFRPGWIVVGRENEVPNPGDYKCVDIIGEQLVMVRDREGAFRVLSRVCLHRWMEVATGKGNAAAFQCPYHLWTYNLGGTLVGAPEMKGVADFDPATCSLPRIRHEVWQGWVFVNLDGAAEPLGQQLAPLEEQLARYGAAGDHMDAQVVTHEYDWADEPGGICEFDWKIFIENFMECYHHIGPHAKSLQKGSPAADSWTDESNEAYSYLHSAKTPEAIAERPWLEGAGNLIHIYPLSVFSIAKQGGSCHMIFPEGAGRCRVITVSVSHPSALEQTEPEELERRRALSCSINEEDKGVNRGVQLAVRARTATVGRLSLLEKPLWEFQQYVSGQFRRFEDVL